MLFSVYDQKRKEERGKLANQILEESDLYCIDYKALDDFIYSYIIEPEFRTFDENLLILTDLISCVETIAGIGASKSVILDNIYYYLKENSYFSEDNYFRNCYKLGKAFNLWNSRIEMLSILLNF